MPPIVNMPEEDQATDIGNMHKKCGKDRRCGSAVPEISIIYMEIGKLGCTEFLLKPAIL